MSQGLPNSFAYEQCDVPPGLRLCDWSRAREQAPKRPRRRALLRRLRQRSR